MLFSSLHLFLFRAKARPSKKTRVNKPSEELVVEPEQTTEPKGPHVDTIFHEPPPPDHDLNEQTEAEVADLADKPTSPIHNDDGPPSPAKATDIPTTPTQTTGNKADDVVITSVGYTSPGNPVVLAKHSAKEERAAMEKGKWSTDLSSYAHFSAEALHSGFLNRLHTNRDYEAGLVNLMKERYEVMT